MMDRRTLLALSGGLGAAALAGCKASQSTQQPTNQGLPPWPQRLQKIAFGSCIDQGRPQPIWDGILADQPDLFIFGGDNVYASEQPWRLVKLQSAYAQLQASPGFAKLRASVPHLAIWDDHDYGLNDGGADFADKLASKQAFIDFWRLPANDARRHREGLYQAVTVGPPGQRVQIILLDCRSFRSALKPTDQRNAPGRERYLPDTEPAKTMLGAAQWAWLAAQLREPADLRLIVSGVQVIVEGHGWEGWHNFPHEQARLIKLIRQSQAKGVLLLSGDRHIGALYRHKADGLYPLYELTSSGMTHAWAQAKELGPNRLGDLVTENHYATVEIDWLKAQVHLLIKNLQGHTLREQRIALAELK